MSEDRGEDWQSYQVSRSLTSHNAPLSYPKIPSLTHTPRFRVDVDEEQKLDLGLVISVSSKSAKGLALDDLKSCFKNLSKYKKAEPKHWKKVAVQIDEVIRL